MIPSHKNMKKYFQMVGYHIVSKATGLKQQQTSPKHLLKLSVQHNDSYLFEHNNSLQSL